MSSNTLFKRHPSWHPVCFCTNPIAPPPLIPIEPMLREHNYHVVPHSRVSSMNFGLTGECQTRQITHRQPPHGTKGGGVSRYGCSRIPRPTARILNAHTDIQTMGERGAGSLPFTSPSHPPPLSGNRIPPRYRTISAQGMLPASLRATHTHRHKHRYTQTDTATVTRLSSPDRHRIHYKYPQRSTRTITHFWLPPSPHRYICTRSLSYRLLDYSHRLKPIFPSWNPVVPIVLR